MTLRASAAAALLCALLTGCAPALPLWNGGTTTPPGRLDLAAGAATRIPLGGLAKGGDLPKTLAAGGVVPGAQARVGVGGTTSMGLLVMGSVARIDLRHGMEMGRAGTTITTFIPMVALHAGAIADTGPGQDVSGMRNGVDVPLLFAVSYGSILELYGGPRVGAEYAAGHTGHGDAKVDLSALSLHVGLTAGLATGFRNFHALLELTAQHEWWDGEVGGVDRTQKGVSLVPSFALQVRL